MRINLSGHSLALVLGLLFSCAIVLSSSPGQAASPVNPEAHDDITDSTLDIAGYCRYYPDSPYCSQPAAVDSGAPQVFYIYFEPGGDAITPQAESQLNSALAALSFEPEAHISITGHADSDGREEDAIDLSVRRAAAVGAWFKERGVNGERISLSGAGASHPLLPAVDESGETLNRRAEVLLDFF